MKVTTLNVALLASGAAAFPAMMDALTAPLAAEAANLRRAIDLAAPQGAGALPASPPPFDAKAQYISNQGAHAFVPPGPNDARGECPGLNVCRFSSFALSVSCHSRVGKLKARGHLDNSIRSLHTLLLIEKC